jgi:hypothetical protein
VYKKGVVLTEYCQIVSTASQPLTVNQCGVSKPLERWTVNDTYTWILSIGVPQSSATILQTQNFTGQTLLNAHGDAMGEILGVPLAHAIKIERSVGELLHPRRFRFPPSADECSYERIIAYGGQADPVALAGSIDLGLKIFVESMPLIDEKQRQASVVLTLMLYWEDARVHTLPSLTEKMLGHCGFRCKDYPTGDENAKCCGDLWKPDVFLASTHEVEVLGERYRNLGTSFMYEKRASLKVAVFMQYHQFPFDNHQWLMSWRLREHRKHVRLVPMEVIWPSDLATSGFDAPHFELRDCFEQPIADGFVRQMHNTDPSARYMHPLSEDCKATGTFDKLATHAKTDFGFSTCTSADQTWLDKDIKQQYLNEFVVKGNFTVRKEWTCGGHAIPAPTADEIAVLSGFIDIPAFSTCDHTSPGHCARHCLEFPENDHTRGIENFCMTLCEGNERCRGVGLGFMMPPSPVTMQCCFFAAVTLYQPGLPGSAGSSQSVAMTVDEADDTRGAQCATLQLDSWHNPAWRNGGDQMDMLMHGNFYLSTQNDEAMLNDGYTFCDSVTMRISVNRTYNYYVTSHHMPLWMMGLLPVVTTVLSPDMVEQKLCFRYNFNDYIKSIIFAFFSIGLIDIVIK